MVNQRKYDPDGDFNRIRDFLVKTYSVFNKPLNWRIERWNYARYFVAPFLGMYGQEDPPIEHGVKAIHFWEDTIGIWESDQGEIVGVVNMEHPDKKHPGFGEAFLQRHPDHLHLLDEMLDYAEKTLLNKKTKKLHIYVHDDDDTLQDVVQKRGYEKDVKAYAHDLEYVIQNILDANLPDGFVIQSMAAENDIEKRREIFGRAFNDPDPIEWPSAFSYEELQKAPDYRKDLDVYIIGPDANYVACCIVWYDEFNNIASLEPVGSHPEFRGLGLGREIVLEGVRRVSALGSKSVWVGSCQKFYEVLGFQIKHTSYRWEKKF